ncbi:DDE superfamily endonuclease [Nitrosospira multiformis]|uniref:DDE superfamily endonuclease n=1 Tax=Nitrosospira multiformis TaxID=1231 RepID=A0A1H8HDT9_9PROT|nr:DDE superfamily endonuclease [Nitrosospira multiformis]
MITIVINQGKARWMIIEETFNSDKLIEFLKAQIRDASRKAFLILDNLRVHQQTGQSLAWTARVIISFPVSVFPSCSKKFEYYSYQTSY